MDKKCNKIIIKSEDGYRDAKSYESELVVIDSHVSYKRQIYLHSRLLQDTSSEVYLFKKDTDSLFFFVDDNEITIDEKYSDKDGLSFISLTFYFDDGTEKEIHARYNEIKYLSNGLFKFLRLLDKVLDEASINPGYLYYEPEYDRY